MNQRVEDAREKRAEDFVGEVKNAKDFTRMFKQQKPCTWNTKKSSFSMKIKNDVCHNHKSSKRS